MSALRILPLRALPRPGEGLDSWVDALAARHQVTPADLLPCLGIPAALRRVAALATALPVERVRGAELAAALPVGALDVTLPGPLAAAGWLRTGGSRYCPQCLAETGGVWLLRWRLAWVFSCPRHTCVLRDQCEMCGGAQRVSVVGGRAPIPAVCCGRYLPGRRRCGADLREASPGPLLTPGIKTTAGWIEHLAEALHDPHRHADAAALFADLPAVACWLLRRRGDQPVPEPGADVKDAQGRVTESRLHRDAVLTATILHQARQVMAGDEAAAIMRLRAMLREEPTAARIPPPGMPLPQWKALASGFDKRVVRAADPDLGAIDRLRMKSMTQAATKVARPTRRTSLAQPDLAEPTRERLVPQLIWPDWAAKLLPASGLHAEQFRAVMSVCLLIPGTGGRTLPEFAALLSPRLTGAHISIALQILGDQAGSPTGDALTEVLSVLCHLADHIDRCGSPIDYRQRRQAIPPVPIDWETWCTVATSAGTQPGARPDKARHLHAQRYLHQLLTGSDLADRSYPLSFTDPNDRARYIGFTLDLTPRLRRALHEYAERLLADLGIDEPVTWSPPAAAAGGLAWPGVDIDTLDLDAVRRIILEDKRSTATAAEDLGVNIEHVRLAIERLDRPEPQWTRHGPDAWLRRQQAATLFTREFFEREYVQGGRRLDEIAETTGYNRTLIAAYAKDAGITLATAVNPFPIDEDWLREQYTQQRRSTTDIARQIGANQMTVNRALYRYSITPRPSGVASFPQMITTLGSGIPRDVRRAVEGALHGFERLRRFQIAMQFPSMDTAATYLGISHSVLIIQFQRLEKDIGGPLFHRSVIGTPQRPTRRGTALLHHLDHHAVRDLMASTLGDRPEYATPPTEVTAAAHHAAAQPQRRSPPTPYGDIAVTRIRIHEPTLILLRDLLERPDDEFYGLEVHARTGIDAGTLYPLLKRLHDAGWLTSRPEDEQEWLAGAPPGRGPGRRRTYYALTPEGRRAALRELENRRQQPRRNG